MGYDILIFCLHLTPALTELREFSVNFYGCSTEALLSKAVYTAVLFLNK